MYKNIYYNLAKTIFKWSLIYFLVLIFLEDVKKSFITSHFTPHIIVLIILVSGLFLFFISEKNDDHLKETKILELERRDNILIIILSILAAAMAIKVIGLGFWGLIVAIIILAIVYYSVRFLYRELK